MIRWPVASASLRRQLLWLIGLRVVTVTVLLGSGVLVQLMTPGALPTGSFFSAIGGVYFLTVVYLLTLGQALRRRWLVDLQLILDTLIVSFLVSTTGGVTSHFAILYILPIVAASILQFRRGGIMVGAVSALAFTGLTAAQYSGLLPPAASAFPDVAPPPLRVAMYTLGLNGFGFLAVAGLTGYLAEGLRRADARLERASTRIADLQAFNQHVIESLTSGLVTTDGKGRVLTFNRAAETITGHRAAAVIGRRLVDLFALPPEFERALGANLEGSRRIDFSYVTGDARRIDVGLSVAPLMTPGGYDGFLFAFQDVTEARRRERQRRIEQRLAAVGEMAAGIAHEIRNPLASISGSIQILRSDLPLSAEQAQLMDIVLRESERLNGTIRDFLTYARPQRISTERLDLCRVVGDTALLLRNSAECDAAHPVEVDLPAHPVWFDADEGQIRQILWNLATNGLRAMPEGGRLRLGVAAPDAAWVALSVADEGVGMSAERREALFQPFQGSFRKGSGLGLAIVHRIVSDYGGQIQIDSAPGRGTVMLVRLPVSDSQASKVTA